MNILINTLSVLVAIEFFYIMFLETFATTSKVTGKTFSMTSADLANKKVQMLFKNQGIYNGLIGIGILYAVIFTTNSRALLIPIMVYIGLVGLYGSLSSGNKMIVVKQAGLAIITLILMLLS